MSFSRILFEVNELGVALITVNRPEKLNALNGQTLGELDEAFGLVAGDCAIRGLVLTGAGNKAFVAGADIQEMTGMTGVEAEELSRRGQATFRKLETMRKPSVAAINGYALGGGLELAMCCTVRFAATEAKLGLPEAKLGIVPGYGATQRLPRLIGRGRALEMLLSAESVSSEEAQRMGLVNRVTSQQDLLPTSREWLGKVISNGPLAVGWAMQAVECGLEIGLEAGLAFEAMTFGMAAGTADCKEGMSAFLERRAPLFIGK